MPITGTQAHTLSSVVNVVADYNTDAYDAQNAVYLVVQVTVGATGVINLAAVVQCSVDGVNYVTATALTTFTAAGTQLTAFTVLNTGVNNVLAPFMRVAFDWTAAAGTVDSVVVKVYAQKDYAD